jgi:branched-chain amino acid transport system permease protein
VVILISAFLVSMAGILVSPFYVLYPHMWLDAMVIAFAATVVGGMGSIWGCILGAFLIGYIEVSIVSIIPGGAYLKQAVEMGIALTMLLLKPQGFFGVKEA